MSISHDILSLDIFVRITSFESATDFSVDVIIFLSNFISDDEINSLGF